MFRQHIPARVAILGVTLLLIHVNVAKATIIWDYSDPGNPSLSGFVEFDESSSSFQSGILDFSDATTVFDWGFSDGISVFAPGNLVLPPEPPLLLPLFTSAGDSTSNDPSLWLPTLLAGFSLVVDAGEVGLRIWDMEGTQDSFVVFAPDTTGDEGRYELVSPIPEPSSLVVFAGLAVIAAVAYRRKTLRTL